MPLSESLRVFLQQRLPSMEQIEVVLLLRRERERSWTAPEVAAALATAPESAAMRLFLLASAGVIVFEASSIPRYRYSISDPELEDLLAELEKVYDADRNQILDVVDTGRRDPVRSFADAFKLKK